MCGVGSAALSFSRDREGRLRGVGMTFLCLLERVGVNGILL